MAILAAGVGFAIRGGIFGDWVHAFNFTNLETGLINGAGFTGFCFGIIIGGVIVDKVGYGKLVAAAFSFHVVSALIAFGAMPGMATKTAFVYLWLGPFSSRRQWNARSGRQPARCHVVPEQSNSLPEYSARFLAAGMVLGGLMHNALSTVNWKIQLALFLYRRFFMEFSSLARSFPSPKLPKRGSAWAKCCAMWHRRRRRRCFLHLSVLQRWFGTIVSGFSGSEFFGFTAVVAGASKAWLYISIAAGAAVWLAFSAQSLDDWSAAFGRAIDHTCARGRCGTWNGRLDSKYRRRHPHARPGNVVVHLHVCAYVRLAILREFHREKPGFLLR